MFLTVMHNLDHDIAENDEDTVTGNFSSNFWPLIFYFS